MNEKINKIFYKTAQETVNPKEIESKQYQTFADFCDMDFSVDETPLFLQKLAYEKTEKEILDFFCNKIKTETDEPDLAKAWQKWKKTNDLLN